MNENDRPPIPYNDDNDDFSRPRKRKFWSKSKTKKITKNISSSKRDDNRNEAFFDDSSQKESSENLASDEITFSLDSRSHVLTVMKDLNVHLFLWKPWKIWKRLHKEISITDVGEQDKYHKWCHISSDQKNAISCTVDIWRELRCACEYFMQKNTPCKHILYILLKVFNIKENSYILQQIYLTKKEIKNCCVSEKSKSNQMAPKTLIYRNHIHCNQCTSSKVKASVFNWNSAEKTFPSKTSKWSLLDGKMFWSNQ